MNDLHTLLETTFSALDRTLEQRAPRLQAREVGRIFAIHSGVVRAHGLPRVRSEEVIYFPGRRQGMALNLDADEIAIVLLDEGRDLAAGQEITRSGKVADVPVGEAFLGRVVDPRGRPLDEGGAIRAAERRPIERPAPAIMDRAPVSVPLQTGIQAVDALIPIGRGQRELILGDRQTGKTAIALDTMSNQRDTQVLAIYCAIGKQVSDVARLVADLRKYDALDTCIVMVAGGDDSPGLKYIAPYAATAMGEYFMDQGRDVVVVYDDLTRHARAYRELSLLRRRRPPAREAYPGDIFYIHSRLLERATHLDDEHGGGSLTALPIIETQAENMSAYIPTNLISITDGQISLSPKLFQEGVLPAIDVGKSVSRVGGKTQLSAYRAVAGDLRLSYSQFRELENFARFGTQLDEDTRHSLERGRRVREVLKQPQYQPLPVAEQIAILLAVTEGLFDEISLERIGGLKPVVRQAVRDEIPGMAERIEAGEPLGDEDRQKLVDLMRDRIEQAEE